MRARCEHSTQHTPTHAHGTYAHATHAYTRTHGQHPLPHLPNNGGAGYEQLVALAGRSAPDEFLKQITYMAMQHYEDSRVDTVRAYHTGLYYLVECDIVLDPRMDLQTAHDIGTSVP